MEVFIATKEDHNIRREEAFLKFSPEERLFNFIGSLCAPRTTPIPDDYVHPSDLKGNFILRRKNVE